uniref:ZP domain-containing protein n=1 Tax=Neogobius melanostomus TaxID=47308 RepID=A0A8C6TJP4_9GOBI
MKLFLILFLWPALASSTPTISSCGDEARRPKLDDISVICGTTTMTLLIQICPVIYTGYNESHLVMNNIDSKDCHATLDTTVFPPVSLQVHKCPGNGIFADFSNIQRVNISGMVQAVDPTTGLVTYNAELKYRYSCEYPLEYLVNNTQVNVSGSSVSVTDRNGTFLSTLSMTMFTDKNFTEELDLSDEAVELRKNIYVEVKATNLTTQYHVLLDRCYASISPLPANSSFFNLFVPCDKDKLTTMISNGESQRARFVFPAFRFIEQQDELVSTYYLHCITRLCEKSICSVFKQCSRRRKRDIKELDPNSQYTLTSSEILIKPSSTLSSQQKMEPVKAITLPWSWLCLYFFSSKYCQK